MYPLFGAQRKQCRAGNSHIKDLREPPWQQRKRNYLLEHIVENFLLETRLHHTWKLYYSSASKNELESTFTILIVKGGVCCFYHIGLEIYISS